VGSFGAGGLGELWIRWRVYIYHIVLGLGLETFSSFSGVGHGNNGWVSEVVRGQEQHSGSFIYRRFGIVDSFFVFFFSVDARIFFVLLWVVCGLLVNGIAKFVPFNLAVLRRRLYTFTGGVFSWFFPPRSFALEVKAPLAPVCG
jgi:hypothetical protein